MLDGEAGRDADADGDLPRSAHHGVDVGEVDHGGLVAEVLEGDVADVEVDAFEQQVGGYEHFLVGGVGQHGGVVADAADGGGVDQWYVFGEAVDEAELAQGVDFCHSLIK